MAAKRVNRRRGSKSRFEWPEINWRRWLASMVLLGVLLGAYQGTIWLMDKPIESVTVAGTFQRVASVRVEAAIEPFLTEGFLGIDLNLVRQRLEEIPWIASARVQRKWPSVVAVAIEEERAAARWGKNGLLNVNGHLFVEHATHVPIELARLNGPDGTQLEVARRYFQLQTLLEQRGLSVTELQLNERGAWVARLSNGIQVRFGSVSLNQRMQRFFRAFDQVIAPINEKVRYVDMRYTNGFSVGWKNSGSMNAAINLETDGNG
jgi:cell division protein FtsQ